MTQLAIPVEVSAREVAREKSLGDAIQLCLRASGQEVKELTLPFNMDKGQFSRWISGDEGIKWHKLQALMDACGNDAPLLWMAYDRGYDLHSMHKRESETERENRLLKEENAALRRVLMGAK
mgnify:CR=1 FL=1